VLSRSQLFKIQSQGFSLLLAVTLTLLSVIFQFSAPSCLSETFEDISAPIVAFQNIYRPQEIKPVDQKRTLALILHIGEKTIHLRQAIEPFFDHLEPIWLEQDKIRDPPAA